MVRHDKPGKLICIEGIDGAGKTSHCARLQEDLVAQGYPVVRLYEPTNGTYGRKIRELARQGLDETPPEKILDLFVLDRRENVEKNILPALENGALVLMDRYYYSTIAYQGAAGLDTKYIRRENETFAPAADLLLYLRIPASLARARIEQHRGDRCDLFEREAFLAAVQAIFDSMEDPVLKRIDAAQAMEQVYQVCWKIVQRFLEDVHFPRNSRR